MKIIQNYIYQQVASKKLSKEDAKAMLLELQTAGPKHTDDIAIIGMACKLPGIKNVREYWQLLADGRSGIRIFPEERAMEFADASCISILSELFTGYPLPKHFSKDDILKHRGIGGFLEDIDKFDAAFFRISPKEAKYMDPTQRMMLETSWEAIEDAGYNRKQIQGTKTGVFIGQDHYTLPLYRLVTEADPMHLTGSWPGILASRISYILNLQGPSIVVDTACSSGLVALNLALKSLKSKESDMAIVGGIQIQCTSGDDNNPQTLEMVSSNDFVVRTFDKRANGTVWSEGVVSVILKPLKKALKDLDNIYAVVKGAAINNDGASNGLTAPSAQAQEKVLIAAWKDANINPESVSYIEAHGTGTIIGDPIEVKGLTNAFRAYTERRQFCAIGAHKSNIGHTVAASGLAGLLKVVLAMKNGIIPPSINFREPNPFINFPDSPLYVNDRAKPWENAEGPRRAGVSSFGFSGTNAHVVLEEFSGFPETEAASEGPFLLALSGRNAQVLSDLVHNYLDFIAHHAAANWADVCYTANCGRGHYTHRLVLIFDAAADLREKLEFITRQGLETCAAKELFFGKHKLVARSRANMAAYEMTESARNKLSSAARQTVQQLGKDGTDHRELLKEICRHYAAGAEIPWELVYQKEQRKRVSVPGYPLERLRYWADPKVFTSDGSARQKEFAHPFLDRCLADVVTHTVYISEFSMHKLWILKEHKFMNNYIFPGIAYLELVRAACYQHFGHNQIELKDVIFLAPLIVQEDEIKDIQTILQKEKDHLKFTVSSLKEEEGLAVNKEWVIHTQGTAKICPEQRQPEYNLAEIEEKCSLLLNDVKANYYYKPEMATKAVELGFKVGPHWGNVTKVFSDEAFQEALITIELAEEFTDELDEFYLHPSMLDDGLNTAMFSPWDDGVFLPFLYKDIKLYGKMPRKFYSYCRLKSKNELKTYDVSLLDESGKVFLDVTGYAVKKLSNADKILFKNQSRKEANFFEMHWINEELAKAEEEEPAAAEGVTVILKQHAGPAAGLVEELQRTGLQIVEIEAGQQLERPADDKYICPPDEKAYTEVFKELNERRVTRIIHLLSLSDNHPANLQEFKNTQRQGVYSLFFLVRALFKSRIRNDVDLVVISDCINEITGKEAALKPFHATLFGLAKVVGGEYNNLITRTFDIDLQTSPAKIAAEILHPAIPRSYQVAYRNDKRYMNEFRYARLEAQPENPIEIEEGGVYVITGGLGGLGIEIGKYLCARNKVKLALLSRSSLPPRAEWDAILSAAEDLKTCRRIEGITEMEAHDGVEVVCYQADVSNEQELGNVFTEIRKRQGDLRGIVHCAGLAGDGFLIRKDERVFREVLAPKVEGTWIMDRITSGDKLDFLILFSSITALTGGAGQGDYTAANSFLDAFAVYRNKKGKRTISINWPAWNETGMAVDYGMTDEATLFKSIGTADALEAFDAIINSSIVNVVSAELNLMVIAAALDELPIQISTELKSLLEKYRAQLTKRGRIKKRKTMEQISLKGKNEAEYSETEKRLALLWCEILDLAEIDVYEGFNALGGDSILATQLLGEIEQLYPGLVDISDIFTYSSVIDMAQYIEGKQQKAPAEESVTAAAPASELTD